MDRREITNVKKAVELLNEEQLDYFLVHLVFTHEGCGNIFPPGKYKYFVFKVEGIDGLESEEEDFGKFRKQVAEYLQECTNDKAESFIISLAIEIYLGKSPIEQLRYCKSYINGINRKKRAFNVVGDNSDGILLQ